VQPDQPTLQALVHIAREAVTNAVKHADPFLIEAVFEHGDEWRLCVTDDGRGLGTNGGAGFGLLSMRHRAQALGGTLRVHSAAGAGTTVEAILP
jgi:signal transduction histidine kinase